MKKLTNDRKLCMALTLLQILCGIALLLGTQLAGQLGFAGSLGLRLSVGNSAMLTIAAITGLATVLVVSLCSYIAIIRFMVMCQRLKKESAFSEQNGKALKVISRVCSISTVTLLVGYAATMLFAAGAALLEEGITALLGTLLSVSVPFDVLAFLYLGVSLATRALAGLLTHAKALQDENDLTV